MALENLYFEQVNFSVNIFLSDDMLCVCGVKCLYYFKTEVVEIVHEVRLTNKLLLINPVYAKYEIVLENFVIVNILSYSNYICDTLMYE